MDPTQPDRSRFASRESVATPDSEPWPPSAPNPLGGPRPLGAANPLGAPNPLGAANPLGAPNPLGGPRPLGATNPLRAANPLGAPNPLGGPRPLGAATPIAAPGVAAPPPLPGAAARRPVKGGAVYRGVPAPIRIIGWVLLAIVVGVVIGATGPTALRRVGAVAALQPGLLAWYTVRALGFLAYFVLAASVLYGLLLSTKILDAIAHRPVSFALHKDLAIVALLLGVVHASLLIFDQSFQFTPRAIIVPFASPYAPMTVGIGQLTLYATAVVTASFYLRRHIGQRVWRLIHYITFLAFIGATFHGIASGSDSGAAWAFWIYLIPVAAAVFLITYRAVIGISNVAHRPRVERAGTPVALVAPRGPLDRPGADSGGVPWLTS